MLQTNEHHIACGFHVNKWNLSTHRNYFKLIQEPLYFRPDRLNTEKGISRTVTRVSKTC